MSELEEMRDRYAQGVDRPLGSYLGVMGVYLSLVSAAAVWLRHRGKPLPKRISPTDVALVGMATHRLARLITKDPVTSPLRAPFTEFEGVSGPAELKEKVVGTGVRHAVGELLTCPFCIAQWVGSVFALGLVVAPRGTRILASVFAAVGVADFLHLAYGRLQPS